MGLKVLDLFSGAGGMSLGFSYAGFEITDAIEIDKHAVETHQLNFPRSNTMEQDIRKINPLSSFSEDQFDLIIGGPPCQGFSTIGRPKIASLVREGIWTHMKVSEPRFIDDPRNILYNKFLEFVDQLKPSYYVMENVPGILSYKNGEIVQQILKDFSSIGYSTSYQLLLAAAYGVPQLRKRIFFIGNRLENENIFPKPSNHSNTVIYRFNEDLTLTKPRKYITVGEAILDLPVIENCKGKEEMEYTIKSSCEYQEKMRSGSSKVFNHISRCTNERDLNAFRALNEGQQYKHLPQEIKDSLPFRQDIFHDKLKRLHSRKPAWTLVAHLYKDGYMYIHPIQNRSITVREAARLQSFPDKFRFSGSRTAQFKQVGNAVPPLLSQAIAEEIVKML